MNKQENQRPKYPGKRITTNGNVLVSYFTEARLCEAGVFYPITPSTEMGENFQMSFANGELNVFGSAKIAIETEGEHAAQGGAIAGSLAGKRVVNFTSGQGIVYGSEQYYHAPGKMSTMVLNIAARALTKAALNVHCGHDDVYAVLDTGWIMLFAKDAQQASDQAMILRRVTETSLTPGMNIQDGFLTSHLERTFNVPEADLIREYLGRPEDMVDCPTPAQKELFGPKRRRIPIIMDIKNPLLIGPVQNQEHYMNSVIARRNNFVEPILDMLEEAYADFAKLTGRHYGLISEYKCDDAETVFVSLGSSAENIEPAVDELRTRGEKVGRVHINVIRPFPEKAIIEALRGKKNVIVLERIDEQMGSDNPITREIRSSLAKALENSKNNAFEDLPTLTPEEMPRITSGVYGLGSRDFRPEGILGAYGFATGTIARNDGKKVSDGVSFFYVGVDHPYAVIADETPSFLPDNAIAIRFHSIGGWGAITTGKNLGEIIGDLSGYIAKRDDRFTEDGEPEEVYHISANPKYGSEKKGAPTNYFLVAAPDRIRVNCDLKHVNAVLCCDPKAFTHTNPIGGMADGGALIIETDETTSEGLWSRIPQKYRQEVIDKDIRIFGLPGFQIAIEATERLELQYRMQGNSFLGAFFKVSSFLKDNTIPEDEFLSTVAAQYSKKFSRFGQSVVDSNMQVMNNGFKRVWEMERGDINAPDKSAMRGEIVSPVSGNSRFPSVNPEGQAERVPLHSLEKYNSEFRAGLGYDQPSSALASTGVMAAATAATISKYVARRRTPIFIPENCTQCMDCIESCPDTAMPNSAQDVSTVISTSIENYVSDDKARKTIGAAVQELDDVCRAEMNDQVANNKGSAKPFGAILNDALAAKFGSDASLAASIEELRLIVKDLPMAYSKARTTFEMLEKKNPGAGGLFNIMVNDLCKGCGECVVECGDKSALRMEHETEEINGMHDTHVKFLDLLPETAQKYLGKFDALNPEEAKAVALKNHLMIRSNYDALVSGDGACAGCGEKTVLRATATITETFMRNLYHKKAVRFEAKAKQISEVGTKQLAAMDDESKKWWSATIKHLILGLGGEDTADSLDRMEKLYDKDDAYLLESLSLVLRQEAFNHRDLRAVDERYANGMSVQMMTSCTGCNSVYGSTHPANPHAYPWMNSLFQDSSTLAWIYGESMIMDHSKRSVIPERLVDTLLSGAKTSEDDYFTYTHFSDAHMTDLEVQELPKVWAIGGDGAFGDIGFQNLSKVVLQNRPNVKLLMLDTQVYSNTGGQNSDSSVMPGGFDMNQHGAASEGKLTERKEVAQIFMSGHGSPFVAQVSMANSANMFKAILDSVMYRGTSYLQAFTTCQPEHGVADDMSTVQAQIVRDSRGMPEFVFNPALGEVYSEALSLKGNPDIKRDWRQKTIPGTKDKYNYTVAHWATTESRFRKHLYKVTPGDEKNLIHLDEIMARVSQHDVTSRYYLIEGHRAFVPVKGVYIMVEKGDKMVPMGISRQMALFCVERRKNWRILQSMAGIENEDYKAQKG